ncbi:MAG: DUF3526 domain-containing protein [Sediminibacterium sp.]
MKQITKILLNEYQHFIRSPFKVVSLLLFMGAAIYGLQNGLTLYKKQQLEIAAIKTKDQESIQKVEQWFKEGKAGPEDRPWVNITKPFWAVWYMPTTAVKAPSPMMPFSLGQSEQFGYYKKVTNWSTIFDGDLAEEIANPERLTVGTLDFSFVLIYLLPILIIVWLFNIGGLEKDLGFSRLIQVNQMSSSHWLLARFMFYFGLLIGILLLIMTAYAFTTPIFSQYTAQFFTLLLYIFLYMLLWFAVFYAINYWGKGSSDQALKMVAVWLVFCILVPGAIHQSASLKYPVGYMTDFIDITREESEKLQQLSMKDQRRKLFESYPTLANTKQGKDTSINEEIMGYSSSALANQLMINATAQIEAKQEQKNQFIKNTYLINPVSLFQNNINNIAGTDYYAYQAYRKQIQQLINQKIEIILMASWNKDSINQAAYSKYLRQLSK